MGFLTTWAVDGSRSPAAVARRAMYAATKGVGVVEANHLKLVGLGGGTLGLGAGSVVIAGGKTGQRQYERYIATVESTDGDATASVPVPVSTARTFEAVVTIPDPEHAGVPAPDDPLTASYAKLELLTTAQYNALTVPHYRIATVVIPANASVITHEMVTDRRELVDPRRLRFQETRNVPSGQQDLTSSSFINFPEEAAIQVQIPSWASRAIIRADLLETLHMVGDTDGQMVMTLGGTPSYTDARRFDEVWSGSTARVDHAVVASFNIPEAQRGTQQSLRMRARRMNGSGYLRADAYTQVLYDIEFTEVAG